MLRNSGLSNNVKPSLFENAMEEIISPKDEVRGGDMEKGAHGKGCVHGGSQPRPEV